VSEQTDLLAETKPLSDSLRFFTRLLVVMAFVIPLFFLIAAAQNGSGLFLGYLSVSCVLLATALLIAPAGKPNAIYLRAFRTDESTARLRARLGAALGRGYRLSGIRPPRKKTSTLVRFLMPYFAAMRYGGSKFMELEAGDDWMARLWKTYQETRLVFIDVRDVTPYVHQEIEMTLKTMGIWRCIFIIGPGKTRDEWRQTISAIAGPDTYLSQFKLLDASSPQLEADLRALVKVLPEGFPAATERGRQYVLDHVSENELKKGLQTSPARFLATLVGCALSLMLNPLLMIMVALYVFLIPWSAVSGPAVPYRVGVIALLACMILPISRTFSRFFRLVDAGNWAQATRAALSLIAAITLLAASVAVIPFRPGIRANALSQSQGRDTPSAISSLRAIQQAEARYRAAYTDRGYASSLKTLGGDPKNGPPTSCAAQLIPVDLASGGQKGYVFELLCTGKVKKNGVDRCDSFNVYATPERVGYTGDRGYCTDESGVIKFDPGGGVSCTESPE